MAMTIDTTSLQEANELADHYTEKLREFLDLDGEEEEGPVTVESDILGLKRPVDFNLFGWNLLFDEGNRFVPLVQVNISQAAMEMVRFREDPESWETQVALVEGSVENRDEIEWESTMAYTDSILEAWNNGMVYLHNTYGL